MKVTKKMIDDTAAKYFAMAEAKEEFKRTERAFDEAMAPILAYVDEDLNIAPEKAADVKGHHTILRIGKHRVVRSLNDPVQALVLLEKREKGLGYANIKLALNVLEKNLALPDYEHLLDESLGKRSVKAIELES